MFLSFEYDPRIVASVKDLCEERYYDAKTCEWEVPLTRLSSLLDNLSVYGDIELTLLKEDHVDEVPPYSISTYKTSPYPYQREGIEYGLTHDRWLLLDMPGLGKTLQVIYLAEERKKHGLKHCVIICGVNILKENWKSEIEKHTGDSCRIIGQTVNSRGVKRYGSIPQRAEELEGNPEAFFIITNIETLRDDRVVEALRDTEKYDMLVVDEVHHCKSPSSISGKNLLKLVGAHYRVGLTGTILLNSPLDAYVPLRWIGAEHCSYTAYKYFYCDYGGPFHNIVTGFKNISLLKAQLEDVSLRRTKDLLDLPSKTVVKEYLELEEPQRNFYEEVCAGISAQVDKIELKTASVLSLVTRLRQALSCPWMLTTNEELKNTAKITRALELAEEIIDSGQKVVIYSVFKEPLYRLVDLMQGRWDYTMLTGDVKEDETAPSIRKFQEDPNCKVMLGTVAKMGTGITLTAASYEIFIDSAWTSATEEQCEDRCWRIGTTQNVTVYKLICKDTIDERVDHILGFKSALSDYVVDDSLPERAVDSLRAYIKDL